MRHGGHHGVYGTPTGVGKNGAGQQQGNNSTTSLAMLEEFARASGLPAAEFQLMESKTNKKAAAAQFLCTVELDGIKYKSYPDYRPTAELAKEAAAAKALAALGNNTTFGIIIVAMLQLLEKKLHNSFFNCSL